MASRTSATSSATTCVSWNPSGTDFLAGQEARMRIPISWLKDYVDLDEPVAALAERLTLAGLEVEAVHRIGEGWDPATLVVGRVAAVRPHPAADRLALVEVVLREAGAAGSERSRDPQTVGPRAPPL